MFACVRPQLHWYLVHQQLSHLHVVVESSQVQCGVTIVLLLIYNPRPREFG